MLDLLVIEDNERLRPALAAGLAEAGTRRLLGACASGEEALGFYRAQCPGVANLEAEE